MKKILILLGHSDCDTFSGHLADNYEKGAREAGHEVKRVNICDLQFDPILHKGYKEIQALEPDLIKIQEDLKWSEHFVLFYPNWWGTMPALLKGMFDRMILPGFAFRFNKDKPGWQKLLSGRSARVVITMDMNPWKAFWVFGDVSNEIKRAILGFCGFSPVKLTKIGPVKDMEESRKNKWIEKMSDLGRKAV